MAAPRRRDLVRRRRRVEDEGEDDASVATEHLEDSQSEASLPSDAEEDADADYSDLSDAEATASAAAPAVTSKANGFSRTAHGPSPAALAVRGGSPPAKLEPTFTTSTDTEVMMNGLKLSGTTVSDEAVEFEAIAGDDLSIPTGTLPIRPASSNGRRETPAERRRRENEEYRKRKEEDPAFIPNRGPFFMHDQRHAASGHAGTRQSWRGRGRGRPPVGGPFSPANLQAQAEEAANGTWAHDLHETLLESEARPFPQNEQQRAMAPFNPASSIPNPPAPKPAGSTPNPAPVRSFSTTRETAKALVRVFLPGMKTPVTFPDVPLRLYARLPNHRPPLRRDKPVRISLPDQPPRYIFPSTERSFIFIPRAMRPNQHGFGRGRGRGFGSFGGYSSRRTSVYGGSVYSPSVAMSRRSSLAREYGRDGLISPAGSVMSRGPPGPTETVKPVVRLPPGTHQHPGVGTPTQPFLSSGGGTPVVNLPQPHSYPLPQRPALRENYSATALPMHQPRPQKAVSVAGIESPESIPFQPPQPQEQQPFHQQVPVHLSNPSSTEPPTFFPHTRQLSYPNQPTTGTPLSNIPERAIHAQPFQPFQPQLFQPGFPSQPGFFYPNGVQAQYTMGAPPAGGMVPVFVQPNGQQVPYVVPNLATNISASQQQNNMVAHESNGMVYYYDPNQLYAAPPVEGYAAPGYTVPGMGGMMTPSPDGYYYPQVTPAGTVYYQPQ